MLQFAVPMISVGSNLVYEEPEEGEGESAKLKALLATNLCDLRRSGREK